MHNQRIERLWRDVFSQCIVLFYHLFSYMEVNMVFLMWIMIFTCFVSITLSLHVSIELWLDLSLHGTTIQGSLSPNQLWIIGLARSNIRDEPQTEVSIFVCRVPYNAIL